MIVIHDADILQVLLLQSPALAWTLTLLLSLLADTPVPFRVASWRPA